MADVFEAMDLRLERRVAIKRYRAAPHGTGLRRFMSEAELLGGLSHPGLLTVFDMSFDGERPFLVLRLARGGTLRDRLDTGPLLRSRVAEIGASVAEVLAYVHDRGIVHRDVKPSNVLFDEAGDCYLADFGIARAISAAHITDSSEFLGTAAYLAPEQVLDRSPGPAADVYALGLVLLECLTGEPEYQGTDVEAALARLSRPPRIPNDWGPEWRAVLTAMTATDPDDRPDAARCVTLLRALEAGHTVPMPLPVRRSGRVYAGMATVAAAAVTALAFLTGPVRVIGEPAADPAQVVRTAVPPEQPVANTPEPQATADPPAPGQDPPADAAPVDDQNKGPKPGEPGEGENKGKPGNSGEGNGSGQGSAPGDSSGPGDGNRSGSEVAHG